MAKQRGADRSAEVMATLAPIETRAAQRSALGAERCDVDAERRKESAPASLSSGPSLADAHQAALSETVVGEHAELAGDVVVAHTRFAHQRVARTERSRRCAPVGDADQTLEQVGEPRSANRKYR